MLTRLTRLTPLILTPGAGSNKDHSSLLALEQTLQPRRVVRMDFPYREAGKKFPDKAPVLVDAICTRADEEFGEGAEVVLGGRSMGGRICSLVAAQQRLNVVGLVLICYPLHPPGKPDRLRTEHFPDIAVPCLFVSGSRDTFGTPEELALHLESLPGEVTSHTIEGADHSLKGHDQTIASLVSEWLAERERSS